MLYNIYPSISFCVTQMSYKPIKINIFKHQTMISSPNNATQSLHISTYHLVHLSIHLSHIYHLSVYHSNNTYKIVQSSVEIKSRLRRKIIKYNVLQITEDVKKSIKKNKCEGMFIFSELSY